MTEDQGIGSENVKEDKDSRRGWAVGKVGKGIYNILDPQHHTRYTVHQKIYNQNSV